MLFDRNIAVLFDSFGTEYIPQEVLKKVRDKSITQKIFRIQNDDSIMCGIYCIAFIEYMLTGKTLLDYANLRQICQVSSLDLKKIDEARNYLIEEIKYNDLMSEEHKKICKYLNYVENLLILASTITGCVSISAFTLLIIVIPTGITSSAMGLKSWAITAWIKNYKSIEKKKKKNEEIVLLGKTETDTIEVLISKVLMDWHISHDKFLSVKSVLREYNEKKEEIKNPETSVEYII